MAQNKSASQRDYEESVQDMYVTMRNLGIMFVVPLCVWGICTVIIIGIFALSRLSGNGWHDSTLSADDAFVALGVGFVLTVILGIVFGLSQHLREILFGPRTAR